VDVHEILRFALNDKRGRGRLDDKKGKTDK